jgi:MarR family 2-MHQ and catechol resistance regulon transcriptional repressor
MKDSEKTTISGVHLWLITIKAFHAIAARVGARLRRSGLGESDFRVLEVLLHKGPMPVNAIGPKVMLTPGSISVAVERLHERGLVSRLDCPNDRRVRTVDLTAQGRKLITRVFEDHARDMEELAADLTPSDRRCLADLLKKLGKKAELEK